jgi:hypothetical protein
MKKSITFLSLSIMLGSCVFAYAQSKGQGLGHASAVGQGHGQIGGQGHSKTTSSNQGTPSTSSSQQTKASWETKFVDRFRSDPAFQMRIKALIGDMDPALAASEFRNHGQFMATMHVAHNLNIPFDALKAKVTGVTTTTLADGTTQTTKTDPMSLGKAIQDLRPTLTPTQVNVEVHKAESQATTTEKTGPTT